MYKLCFFVPEQHADAVKAAVFAAGAGKIGDYDNCCWQTLGQGQFRPLEGSQPFIGQQGAVEQVSELKVEMVCAEDRMQAAVRALLDAHPYEEPAYDILTLVDPSRFAR
ncbi:MAG: YqfO family protein [Cellvibrionaceae bacterium]